MKSYTVTKDVERDAPLWLIRWIDYGGASIIWHISKNGCVEVKGVRIGHEMARIGDKILFDGKRPTIERTA